MGVCLPTEFLFGLFVYLRQAALSLDRVQPGSTLSLRELYDGRRSPMPGEVIRSLNRYSENNKKKMMATRVRCFFTPKSAWVGNRTFQEILDSLETLKMVLSGEILREIGRAHV